MIRWLAAQVIIATLVASGGAPITVSAGAPFADHKEPTLAFDPADGGITWSVPARLTESPIHAVFGRYGDYLGAAAARDGAFAVAWTAIEDDRQVIDVRTVPAP